jgi:hypothetical protein
MAEKEQRRQSREDELRTQTQQQEATRSLFKTVFKDFVNSVAWPKTPGAHQTGAV